MSNPKPVSSDRFEPATVNVGWLLVALIAFVLMMGVVAFAVTHGGA